MLPLLFATVLGAWSLLKMSRILDAMGEDRVRYHPPLESAQGSTTIVSAPDADQWLVDFFQDFPESTLKEKYPEQHRLAMAVMRYRALEIELRQGTITPEQYDRELEAILPAISLEKIC